jgi:uncharacterized protein
VSALLAGAAQAQQAPSLPLPLPAGTRLDVQATGEVTRVPDLVTISAGVVSQAETAGAALSANAAAMARTLAALRKAGIADRDLQTAQLSLQPQYRYGENVPPVITGYQASNQVNVRFRDVKKAGPILDALVAAGANQINGPSFELDQPEAALDEARGKAVATARERAALYARAAGLRVKRIVAISEGGGGEPPRPMPMLAMARAPKMADTAVEAGEQKLQVAINVTFELE